MSDRDTGDAPFEPVTTRTLPVDAAALDGADARAALHEAARLLRAGRLVAFPTETVYGLGANALDSAAIARIYAAKQRPARDPIIAHIHDREQLHTLAVNVPTLALELADAFWPGPLTLVLQRAERVPASLAAGRETVAVRMPAHPVAQALLRETDLPIAAPSANTFSRPSATTAAHVRADLNGRVDLILDAGPTPIGLESTVLDLTSSPPAVLRPGGLLLADLQRIAPQIVTRDRYATVDAPSGVGEVAPGQLLRHYAPHAEMLLYTAPPTVPVESVLRRMRLDAQQRMRQGQRVGLLVADEDVTHLHGFADVMVLGPRANLPRVGRRLFDALRSLDQRGVDVILARDFGRDGLGAALWDRLLRAAEGHVIRVEA